jgi:beta-lactamase class A
MRYPRLLACVAALALTAAGCVAAREPQAAATPPALVTPHATTSLSTLPTPDPTGTPAGRLPPQPAAPTAEPAPPPAFAPDPVLQRKLSDLLAGDKAEHYGVYVKDLTSSKGAALNADKVFNAASVFKLEVMYEVFRQRDLGLLSFDELLEITDYYASFDLGTLKLDVGQSESIAEALYYMTSVSDNVSAVLLQDRAGAGNINSTMAALGLRNTGLFTEGIPATAQDMGILLEAIAKGPDVDDRSREEMLQLLQNETFDNGVVAGVPRGTKVAHKTGNWSDATNDAAIVFGPKGPYVLVVLSDADHESAVIRAISELVYQHFNPGGP